VASALVSSVSPVAGLALHLVTSLFTNGLTESSSPESIISAIKSDVSAPDKLAELETNHGNVFKQLLTNSDLIPSSAKVTIEINWQKCNQES
jgi:hypothetical protein